MRISFWLVAAFSTTVALAPAVQAQEVVTSSSRVLSTPGTVIEAESVAQQAKVSAGPVTTQNMQPFGPQWGGGAQLFWRPPAPVDTPIRNWPHLTLSLNAPAAGEYTLVLYYTVAPDYGSFRVFLNGAPVKDVSGFAPAVGLRKLELAQTSLKAGPQQLVFTVFSKEPASTNYLVGLDRFEIKPLAAATGTADLSRLARAAGGGAASASEPSQRPAADRVVSARSMELITLAALGSNLEAWDGLARVDNVRLYAKEVVVDEKRQNLLWWFRWSTKAPGVASAVLQMIRTVDPPPIGPKETWLQPPGLSTRLVVSEGMPAPGATRELMVDIKNWVHPPPQMVAGAPIVAGRGAGSQTPGGNAPVVAQPGGMPALPGGAPGRPDPSSSERWKHRFFVRIVPLDSQGQPSGPPSPAVEMTVADVDTASVLPKFTAAGFGFPDVAFATATPGQADTWQYWCHLVATADVKGPVAGAPPGTPEHTYVVKGQRKNGCSGSGGGFDPVALTAAFFKTVEIGFGFLHDAWEAGKGAIVSVAASALGATIGCPGWCEGALEMGLTIAMTSVGLPPTIPDFDAIMEQGKDYLVSQIAAELGKAAPVPLGEELAKEAAEAALDEFIKQAKSGGGGGGSVWAPDPKYMYRPLIFMLRATGKTNPSSSDVTARISEVGGDHFKDVEVKVPPLPMNKTLMIPVAMVPRLPPHAWQGLYPPNPETTSKCGTGIQTYQPPDITEEEKDAAKKYQDCVKLANAQYSNGLKLSKSVYDAWYAKYSKGQVVFRVDLRRGTQEWAMGQTSCGTPLGSCLLPKQ